MFEQSSTEHTWFDDLIGQWEFTHHCSTPDGNDQVGKGQITGKSLGGLWTLLECRGGSEAEGGEWSSIFTLGYDPTAKCYRGTFVASMMTYLWIYEDGQVDETGKKLILNAKGPRFDGKEGLTSYQDSIEKVSRDHWILRSQVLGDDGVWTQFMEGHHHRIGA